MSQKIKPDPEKYCAHCGTRLTRKRFASGVLESLLHFGRRKFCDQKCMARAFDARPSRSADASTSRYHARKMVPPGPCSICGKPDAMDVHHRDGNFTNNRPENLQRICRGCHTHHHRPKGSCVICGDPVKGHGYCDMHYQRFKKHGDPLVVKDNQFVPARMDMMPNPTRTCAVPGCTAKYHANGYCSRHAQQARRGKLP
jgi:5-methylcytosine-specific restriction endonuclease McrA